MVRAGRNKAVKENGCHNQVKETKVLLSTDFLEWGAPRAKQETTVELWGLLSDWSRDREVSEIGSPGPNNEAADDRFDDLDDEQLPSEGLQLSHELLGQMEVSEVAVGGGHCVLVSACGRAFGYGCNARGQLGIGGEDRLSETSDGRISARGLSQHELESSSLAELHLKSSNYEGTREMKVLGAACGSEHTLLLARSPSSGSPRQARLFQRSNVAIVPRAQRRFMASQPAKAAATVSEETPPSPSSLKGRDLVLYNFLRGEKPDDCEGRMLDDILRWDDRTMEAVHDYVQWIFPTDEASMFNSQAPLLSPELAAICRPDLGAFSVLFGPSNGGEEDHKSQAFRDTSPGFNSVTKEEQKALMRCLELMPKEFPEIARSMPHWRARAAAG
eukprot:s2_g31.t1